MTVGYGKDLFCDPRAGLLTGKTVTGATLVKQAAERRATTVNGELLSNEASEAYGFDLASFVTGIPVGEDSNGLETLVQQSLKAQILQDDRVEAVTVRTHVERLAGGLAELSVAVYIRPVGAEEDFTFTVAIEDLKL